MYFELKSNHAWCMVRNCDDGKGPEWSERNIDWDRDCDWEKSTLCVVELSSGQGPDNVSPLYTNKGVKPFQQGW